MAKNVGFAGRPSPCNGLGDVNQDGIVDDYDVLGAEWILSGFGPDGTGTATTEQIRRADVNGDGVVTEADANLIAQYVSGYIDTFPACSLYRKSYEGLAIGLAITSVFLGFIAMVRH